MTGTKALDIYQRRRGRLSLLASFLLLAAISAGSRYGVAAEAPGDAPGGVYLVRVPLPIRGADDQHLIAQINTALQNIKADDTNRPVLVLEFRRASADPSGGTQFERAMALARFLTGNRFQRIRTVAYLPQTVVGHAVLPVLGCEEVMMAPDAELGAAGKDESNIDATMRSAYREIAARRGTFPEPIVVGMLDPDTVVTEVQLVGGGVRYALAPELANLRKQAKVWKEATIKPAGELAKFTGRQLRLDFGFVSHLAADQQQLAQALAVTPEAIVDLAGTAPVRQPLRIDLIGRINAHVVDHAIRAINRAGKEHPSLIFLVIDSPGGAVEPAIRLLNCLSELDSTRVRTVSFVKQRALSVAAPIALLCDDCFVTPDAQLGGPGDTFLEGASLDDLVATLRNAAQAKGRSWSAMTALIDPRMQVHRYQHAGTLTVTYFCAEERQMQPDPEAWQRAAPIQLGDGITGTKAQQLGLVTDTADGLAAVTARFHIAADVPAAHANSIGDTIERLAMQPWFARTMLFIAFFALITEASIPGIGLAGFISGLCFLLFFWSQFLSGTSGWLEVLLFGGGLACLALELFVIPGFGIFGVGGIAMILASIVLASQTFVIPRNAYQMDQLPNSLGSILIACGGVVAAILVLRRLVPETPVLRTLMLNPPDAEEIEEYEKLVDWSHLEGKLGTTLTQLTPSGKAQFGDEVVDVISDATLVPPDVRVVAIEVRGNHVLVEPLDEG